MGRGQGRARALVAAGALLLCGAASRPTSPSGKRAGSKRATLPPTLPISRQSAASSMLTGRSSGPRRSAASPFVRPCSLADRRRAAALAVRVAIATDVPIADFHFPGISGAPGTADVTASLMSSHRGDGIFNPRPIPDLAGDPARLKVSRDPRREDLKRFIHGLVTQEFDGPEPSAAVLDGLTNYVRSLSARACRRRAVVDVTLEQGLGNVDLRLCSPSRASLPAMPRPAVSCFQRRARR